MEKCISNTEVSIIFQAPNILFTPNAVDVIDTDRADSSLGVRQIEKVNGSRIPRRGYRMSRVIRYIKSIIISKMIDIAGRESCYLLFSCK